MKYYAYEKEAFDGAKLFREIENGCAYSSKRKFFGISSTGDGYVCIAMKEELTFLEKVILDTIVEQHLKEEIQESPQTEVYISPFTGEKV